MARVNDISGTRRAMLLAGGGAAVLPNSARAQSPPRESTKLAPPSGRVHRVASGSDATAVAEVARAARDGDTIEFEAGDYPGCVAAWPQNDLTLRGLGRGATFSAEGRSVEGKGTFVMKGKRVRIENLAFSGARVRDRNGAGIRIENGPIAVVNCRFKDNENGILAGNDESIEIDIVDSAFVGNGAGDGLTHNLYVGSVARLHVSGCWLARSRVGHLLKSRARQTVVKYSRLTGEEERTSYELEFPSGGDVLVVGNLIQQGPKSENATIVSFGAEGYRWQANRLTMAFNTLVNDRERGGVFVRVAKGAASVRIENHVLVGKGSMEVEGPLVDRGNVIGTMQDFAAPSSLDYRLRAKSALVGRAGFRSLVEDASLLPTREYQHEATTQPIQGTALTPLSPGAFQRLAQ